MMNWKHHHSLEIVKGMTLRINKEQVYDTVQAACQAAGRNSDEVTVVTVTKYLTPADTAEVIASGLRHLGENRVDRFLEKYHLFDQEDLVWHFIGSLQRRKVKEVINHIDYFHGLDSLSLAQEIQKRATHPVKCFLQVNVSGEESKHGFSPEDLWATLPELAELDKIEVVGLMTMAPQSASSEELVAIFKETCRLNQDLQQKQLKNMPATDLSMGMSGDFELAIQEGATLVRIGSAFFD